MTSLEPLLDSERYLRCEGPRAPAGEGTQSMLQLVLQDGTVLRGRSFGADRAVAGEVVFSTGMTGYVESLTDPSYRGQILTLTYPLQGNYGVPAPRDRDLLRDRFESGRIQAQALVVRGHSDVPSHYAATRSLGDWLKECGVPAIEGIDTRALTRKLREHGTMAGWLLPEGVPVEEAKKSAEAVDMATATRAVCVREPVTYPAGPLEILLVDSGAKDSLVRGLHSRGATVVRVPADARLGDFVGDVDGVMLANGPGDPKDNPALIEQIRTVQDLLTRRCYVTSQNHGYVVRHESLPADWEPWFVNVNDGSNEGVRCRSKPWSSVQFHPEAAPGPEDASFLFDDFLRRVGSSRV